MVDFVDSKVRARRQPSKVRLRKVIKSCESEIFWLMSRAHERQKFAECKSTQNYRWRSWTMVGKFGRGVGQCRCRATNPIRLYGYTLLPYHTDYG